MSFIKKGGKKSEKTLPEQNYQRIMQNASQIATLNAMVNDVGDPADYHFQEGGGQTDLSTIGDVAGTWYDLDLSSIIGANRALVFLRIIVIDDDTTAEINFRTNGNANTINRAAVAINHANTYEAFDVFVVSDSSGVIEFRCVNEKPSDWTGIYITVGAYIKF